MRTLFPIGVVLLILLAIPGVVVFAADLFGYNAEINGFLESQFQISHRLALGLPAAFAMFCIPPLIVLLYFLRLKRKPLEVPSTFLWKKSVEDLHVNRLMQWIRKNILLLLQVFAALVMIYGVLGPRLHGAILGGKHFILIIDNSASMSATDVPDGRLAWAKAEAIKEIDAATDQDSGMVISFSDTAEIRQSYTTNRAELKAAVNAITTTQRPTKIDEALSLAASLANPLRSTENEAAAPANPEPGKERTYVAPEGMQADVHLYSDGKFPPVPEFALANLNLTYHVPPAPEDPGNPGTSDNVGIVRFDAERDSEDPTKVYARAILRNYRNKETDPKPRLEVLQGGNKLIASYDDDESRLAKKRKPLAAKSEKPDLVFTIPDVPENADYVLRLKLESANDSFPLDDEAWVVLGVIRKARVLIIGPENRPLRFFFDSKETKKIAETAYLDAKVLTSQDPTDYLNPSREGKYDLIVFDRCAPDSEDKMPKSNTLFIGQVPPPWSLGVKGAPKAANVAEPVQGPSVRGWNSRHPVMRNLQALDEIDLGMAYKLPELPARTQRLIEGTENLVLLAAMNRLAYTDLVMAFPIMTTDDKWNTNWPLKLSFPLFWRNVVMSLGNVRDAGTEDAIKPGQTKIIRIGSVPELQLKRPLGESMTIARGTRADFLLTQTDLLGQYSVRWTDLAGKGEQTRRFAVNLYDPLESDLSVLKEIKIGNATIQADSPRKQPRDLWKWPVLVGLLALVVEWWVYNRRVQI
ncbi:MAG: vWA domain-containing protein [Fimbriiglobus sp.]